MTSGPPWGKTVSALALHAAVCIMGTQLAVLCSKNHAAHGWQGGAANLAYQTGIRQKSLAFIANLLVRHRRRRGLNSAVPPPSK